jgi:uncharacterized protein (DUF2252 family)
MVHWPNLAARCKVNVVREIQTFNVGRDPERLQLKYRAMHDDPFAFLRGTCHLFYKRLPRAGVLRSGPLAWVCGDLHLQNFGSYKGDNRLVYFDINDFDESALAPAIWDLVRFLASVWVYAGTRSWTTSRARDACRAFVDAYCSALLSGKAYWVERETAQGLVRDLLEGLRTREREAFLDARTVRKGRKRQLLVDGRHALRASGSQRATVTEFITAFAATQPNPDFYRVLDVARRVAGTGSLGLDRYAILVAGKGSPDGNYMLDLKKAMPSSLVPYVKGVQPAWKSEAHRVVALQRRGQAVAMAFLQPVYVHRQSFVLRGLQPTEDRIALDRPGLTVPNLTQAIADMGQMVAWAHLRGAGRDGSAIADDLIDFGRRKKWRESLLALSQESAAQVMRDCQTFKAAFDTGAFDA